VVRHRSAAALTVDVGARSLAGSVVLTSELSTDGLLWVDLVVKLKANTTTRTCTVSVE
jgi:hypothetical protein